MKISLSSIKEAFWAEYERFVLWSPVFLGAGILLYFLLPSEPPLWPAPALLAFCSGCLYFFWHHQEKRIFWTAGFLFCFGFWLIQVKAHSVAAPVLKKRTPVVWVEGKVESVQILLSAQKIILSYPTIEGIKPEDTPLKVRVRVNGLRTLVKTGDKVRVRAKLMPPSFPAMPGSYPFLRKSWFDQLGGVGFALGRLEIVEKAPVSAFEHVLEDIRRQITFRYKSLMDRQEASVAAALIVGEQGSIPKKLNQAYKDIGITHILSVSGFHMSLLAGFAFIVFRFLFSLSSWLSLRVNTKKLSIIAALLLTFGYLLISGLALPAVRSFLMLCVGLLAAFLDRRVLSVRNVAFVAFVLLLFYPEALISASFQLSFGAVLILISGFEYAMKKKWFRRDGSFFSFLYNLLLGVLLTNFLAGFVTMPYVIYHFNRIPLYGLLGNFLLGGIFSFFVIPLLFIGVVLMPFGWDLWPVLLAGKGLAFLNEAAFFLADFKGAVWDVPAPTTGGILLFTLGFLWVCLFMTKLRWVGVIFMFLGMGTIIFNEKYDVYVSQGGKLAAVRSPEGRLLFSDLRKERFVRSVWLQREGEDSFFIRKEDVFSSLKPYEIKGLKVAFQKEDCPGADIAFLLDGPQSGCSAKKVVTRAESWKKGTFVLKRTPNGYILKSSADSLGNRLWNPVRQQER